MIYLINTTYNKGYNFVVIHYGDIMGKEVKEGIIVTRTPGYDRYNGDFILLALKEHDPVLANLNNKRHSICLKLCLQFEDEYIRMMSQVKRWPKFERGVLIPAIRDYMSRGLQGLRNLSSLESGLYKVYDKTMFNIEAYLDNLRIAYRLNYISEGFYKELTGVIALIIKELKYVKTIINREKGLLEKKVFKDKKEKQEELNKPKLETV